MISSTATQMTIKAIESQVVYAISQRVSDLIKDSEHKQVIFIGPDDHLPDTEPDNSDFGLQAAGLSISEYLLTGDTENENRRALTVFSLDFKLQVLACLEKGFYEPQELPEWGREESADV